MGQGACRETITAWWATKPGWEGGLARGKDQMDNQVLRSKSSQRPPQGPVCCMSSACLQPAAQIPASSICVPGMNTTLDIHHASLHNPINGKQWICCLQCEKQSHHENPRPGNTGCAQPKGHPSHSCTVAAQVAVRCFP